MSIALDLGSFAFRFDIRLSLEQLGLDTWTRRESTGRGKAWNSDWDEYWDWNCTITTDIVNTTAVGFGDSVPAAEKEWKSFKICCSHGLGCTINSKNRNGKEKSRFVALTGYGMRWQKGDCTILTWTEMRMEGQMSSCHDSASEIAS